MYFLIEIKIRVKLGLWQFYNIIIENEFDIVIELGLGFKMVVIDIGRFFFIDLIGLIVLLVGCFVILIKFMYFYVIFYLK